jgi:hypothetical protein
MAGWRTKVVSGVRSGIESGWTWLGANKEQLAIVFTVIAAGYVLYEYHASQVDADVKRTMDFQSRYSEKELLTARTALDDVLFDPEFEQKKAATGLKGNDAISKMITDLKLASNVRLLADFYGQVATCMKNELCDRQTACAAFQKGAAELRDNYYGLFVRWEHNWNENLIEPTYKYFGTACAKRPGGIIAWICSWFP